MNLEMALDSKNLRKLSEPKNSNAECSQETSTGNTVDYPGIEYPPAFEPETYTLQHMLRSRQKRDFDVKK